ncbi:hypothetical protein DA098_09260 [Vibrio parahaemolyticus]|nr:hypothetical protein DA098_09260 [Vibrio parahaemolyticus]TMX80467.1 hypothetical protein DA094_02720 [Vibrio parahaemolyticus]
MQSFNKNNHDKGLSVPSRLSIAFVVFYGTFKMIDGFAIELVAFLLAFAVYLVLPKQHTASTEQSK